MTTMSAASNNNYRNSSLSILGRIARASTSRHWSTFVIELALIVVGIILALSIDDLVQEREDQRSEKIYLASLIRDLNQMVESLQAYVDTETAMASASATTLKILAVAGYEHKGEELREYLSGMGTRRTLRLVSAAYADLTSTGNFQLIRSRDLREQLLQYFADVSRTELVVEKNNTVFIDNIVLVVHDGSRHYLGTHSMAGLGCDTKQSGRFLPGISWARYRIPGRRCLCAACRRGVLE